MTPAEQTRHISAAMVSARTDPASFLRVLELHKSEIKWASSNLDADGSAAAETLLSALLEWKSGGLNIEQAASLAKVDVEIIVRSAANGSHPRPASPVPHAAGLRTEDSTQPKGQWLQIAQLLITTVGVVVGSSAGILGAMHAANAKPADPSAPVPPAGASTSAVVIHAIQALVILCFIVIHRRWLKEVAEGLTDKMPIAKKTFEQFALGWISVWWGWLFLYSWLLIAAIASTAIGTSPKMEAVSDVFDVASGFALWYCYFVLDMPSVNIATAPHRDRLFREAVWLALLGGVLIAAFAVTDRLWQLNLFGIALVGIYNGLAIACLTGRLGSHFIGTPRWMLLCLYVYAMLQVFYSFLTLLNGTWVLAVFFGALVLKIVLAFAGSNMMQNGGLRRYLDAAQSGLLTPAQMDEGQWQAVKTAASR